MEMEFEEIQNQIKELESKKISRQKNQCTPEYKECLKARRQFDEEIRVLEEQKNIISSKNKSIEDWKEEFEREYNAQIAKLENDKSKMSKRTYQRNKKSIMERYKSRLEALERLSQELKNGNIDQLKDKYESRIQEINADHQQNEEKINALKKANEMHNLGIDRNIYHIIQGKLEELQQKIAQKETEISSIEKEFESLENQVNIDQEKWVKLLEDKQEATNTYRSYLAYKEMWVGEIKKFTQETLEKIEQLKEVGEAKTENVKTAKTAKAATTETKPADIEDIKFDIAQPKKQSLPDIKVEQIKKIDTESLSDELEMKLKKSVEPDHIKEIYITPMPYPVPHLNYSSWGERGTKVASEYNYATDRIKEITDSSGVLMVQSYEDVLQSDEENFENVDPFLLDYLSDADHKLYEEVITELREGRGLGKFRDIIKYDMTGMKNIIKFSSQDRKIFKQIAKKAVASGLIVEGYKTKKSLLSALFGKKKDSVVDTEVDDSIESTSRNKRKEYTSQYEYEFDISFKDKASKDKPAVTSSRSNGIAKVMEQQ